jgi:hypothetical protein
MKYAAPLAFYRSKSAIRFSPMKPKWQSGRGGNLNVDRLGAFLVEIALAKGKQLYDWENKLTFALSPAEAIAMFPGLKTEKGYRAMHDPHAGTENSRQTSKWFTAKLNAQSGGIALSINIKEGKDAETQSQSIVVDGMDMLLLKTMVEGTVPYLFGWIQSFEEAPPEKVLHLEDEIIPPDPEIPPV